MYFSNNYIIVYPVVYTGVPGSGVSIASGMYTVQYETWSTTIMDI